MDDGMGRMRGDDSGMELGRMAAKLFWQGRYHNRRNATGGENGYFGSSCLWNEFWRNWRIGYFNKLAIRIQTRDHRKGVGKYSQIDFNE
jgi:hypothetical protein